VPPARVAAVAEALMNMGTFEVAISDTIGIAHPGRVRGVVAVVADRVPLHAVALHFHDTRGTALANVLTALELGISTFDASAGGLGGCPYAPGATGNLATEDLIYMLNGLGIETGVDLNALVQASAFVEPKVGHLLASRYYRATVSSAQLQ
jgi:isopropylmalate/homocitrate/citramalate synthase